MTTQLDTPQTKSIHTILLSIGIPPNLLGYQYITYAIALIFSNPEYMHHITKGLYMDIASQYETTPARVERANRHSISVAWAHKNLSVISRIFKNTLDPQKSTPTNSHFLAGIYYYMAFHVQN